jgi:hypothetical protein
MSIDDVHYCSDIKYFHALVSYLQTRFEYCRYRNIQIIPEEQYFFTSIEPKSYSKKEDIEKDKEENKDFLRIGIVYTDFSREPNCYRQLLNRIAIDREDCFDKWSKCPITLPIPETKEQLEYLSQKIDWLLTEEGYVASNEYNTDLWISDYSKELL